MRTLWFHISSPCQQIVWAGACLPSFIRSFFTNADGYCQLYRVYQILGGLKEAERVIFRDEDPENGFIILPDLKWDGTNMSALVRFHILRFSES